MARSSTETGKRLPSVQQLEEMTISELREFLDKHDVDVKTVKATGKTPNRPTKKDFMTRALQLRSELVEEKPPADTTQKEMAPKSTPSTRRSRAAATAAEVESTPVRKTPSRMTRSASKPEKPKDLEEEAEETEQESSETKGDVAKISTWKIVVMVILNLILLLLGVGALLSLRSSLELRPKLL